jgi:hypothetical protein
MKIFRLCMIVVLLLGFNDGCSRFPIKRVVFWSDPTEIIVSINGQVAIRFMDYSEPNENRDAYIHIDKDGFIKFLQTYSVIGGDENPKKSGRIHITPDMAHTEGWKYISAAAAQRENMWFASNPDDFYFHSLKSKQQPVVTELKYDLNGECYEIHLSTFCAMSPREFRKP